MGIEDYGNDPFDAAPGWGRKRSVTPRLAQHVAVTVRLVQERLTALLVAECQTHNFPARSSPCLSKRLVSLREAWA